MKTLCFILLILLTVIPVCPLQAQTPDSFNPDANEDVRALAVQADGKFLMGGQFTTVGGVARNRIARLNADGTLDTDFNPIANGDVLALAVQRDGKILAGGNFSVMGGQWHQFIARLNADGIPDSSFSQYANGYVNSLAVQADGMPLLVGSFTSVGGVARNYIARLQTDGSLDSSFNPYANNYVYSLAVQADGKILIGGDFTTVNGVTRNRIARLNTDGTLDSSFNSYANNYVSSLAVQADGKILIGGGFTTVNGVVRRYLARLNTNGTLDSSFSLDAGIDGSFLGSSLILQADGKILVHRYSITDGVQHTIARLNGDGTLDSSFNPELNDHLYSSALLADGKFLMGGRFTTVGGVARNRIARLTNGPATSTLAVTGASQIDWTRGGSTPEVEQVTFENWNGVSWVSLGTPSRVTGGWRLTGLSLPNTGQIRARGRTTGGRYSGSSGIIEQTRTIGPPDIAFEAPTGTAVSNGTGTLAFGQVTPGQNQDITCTLRNTGGTELTGITPSILGTGASSFSLPTPPPATLAAGGSGTFTVRFSATSGAKTATLSIASDDPDENPFTLTLTGEILGAPVVTLTGPNPLVHEAGGIFTDPGATAADAEDGVLVPAITANTVNATVPGSYVVTWTATDGTMNTGSATRVVNVVDTTAPLVTVPAGQSVVATGVAGAVVSYPAASASDAVGVVSLVYSYPSGSQFPQGATTVTVTATDAAGNVGTGTFTVTVQAWPLATWDGGPAGTGTDWATGIHWDGDVPPVEDTVTTTAVLATPTPGQPVVSGSHGVNGIRITNANGGWSIGGAGTLALGAGGITANEQGSGVLDIDVSKLVMSSSSNISLTFGKFDNAVGTASTVNLRSNIDLHPSGRFQINSTRSAAGGAATVNVSGVLANSPGSATSGWVYLTGGSGSRNTIQITSDNTYTGDTNIAAVTTRFASLADAGQASSFGSSGRINLVDSTSFARMTYVGTAPATTNRRFTVGMSYNHASTFAGEAFLENNAVDPAHTVSFTNTASIIGGGGSSNRRLTLGGSNTGDNAFAPLIADCTTTQRTHLRKNNAGTWISANTGNTYTGATEILTGTLKVAKLAAGGQASSIGASNNVPANLILAGTLAYTGTGDATDRLFQLNGNASIRNDGTGPIHFTGTGAVAHANSGARTLTLSGTQDLATNTLALAFGNNGVSNLNLSATGSFWRLGSANTYDGTTSITAGAGLAIPSTGGLPGWNGAGRWLAAAGACMAVGNAVSDADIATLLGTGNFAAGASLGFDCDGGNRTYPGNLTNTAAGSLGVMKSGSGTLTLTGLHTFSGDVIAREGNLVLAAGSSHTVRPTTNGVTNSLRTRDGASITLGGTLVMDLASAAVSIGNSWQVVSGAVSYGGGFAIPGFTEHSSGQLWTKPAGANLWVFSKTTGSLSLIDGLPETTAEGPGSITLGGVTPAAIGVSTIGVGRAMTLTIRNTGSGTLSILGVQVTGLNAGDFEVTTAPGTTIGAGAATTLQITFTPSAGGPRVATLTLTSNDPITPAYVIELTGTGNTAPTFAGYSVATPWQTAASISLGKLLSKASDADGDTLSVTAAGPTSAQGGTVVLGGSILYTPPAAFSGTDTFSITIADGSGASVSGTVTVGVGPNPNSGGPGVNPPQITMLDGGGASIASQGIPGRTYMVQRSTNLSNWATIGTVTAASKGAVSFIDPSPPQPSAFYRLGRDVPEMNFWGNGSDGALTTTGNLSFGSVQDGDVVVKQFSNLTINAGHTVTTSNRCRGLVIYVNGDCTINGTLSMTARGANVNPTLANSIPATGIRLARFKYGANETLAASDLGGTGAGGVGAAWRAAEAGQLGVEGNGRIFTISREGGAGGSANHSNDWWDSVPGYPGGTNPNGTGGGGGGNAAGGWSGFGAAGTCYSGGSGGGAVRTNSYATSGGSAATYGGAGGYGNWTSPHDQGGGGAGNPGGSGIQPGQSGTGGLLVLLVKGNLTIGATGQVVSRGSNGGSAYQSGGGSGGGRILLLHAGNYSAAVAPSAAGGSGGGAGGAGAITIERIDP